LAVSGQRLASRRSGERLSAVTISLGLAELLRGEDVAAMLERADKALYRAKQEGRDRACWEPMAKDTAAFEAAMPTTEHNATEKIWT